MAPPAPPPPDEDQMNGENTAISAPMTNGPSNSTGTQLWERAWTVNEIRKGSGNWSLAGDAGLLLLLQDFSQRMISRTHEIEKEVDGLVHIAKTSGVKLDNVFNDFIMLANTQFVENRVYDEDVSQTVEKDQKPEEQEKSREEREAELIPKISQALNFGIKVIEDSFETLDVNAANSDSEDEDIPYRADPILEPKDPYVARPLPHIIGSPMFMQEDDVGLVEPPSDAETESHGSISQSESEAEEEKGQSEYSSDEYSDSESEDEKPKKQVPRKAIHSTSSEESEGDGDLFEGKDSEEDLVSDEENEQQQQKPKGAIDFTSELAAKIGVAPKAPPTQESDNEDQESGDEVIEQKTKVKKDRAESSAGKSKKKHGDHKHRDRSKSKLKTKEKPPPDEDGDLFGAPEEDDSPFGQKGLFSGSKGLFDDDGDEGGLFDDMEKPKRKVSEPPAVIAEEEDIKEEPPKDTRPRTKSGRKVPAGGISIFGGGDDDLFTESIRESSDSVSEKPSGVTKSQPITPAGGLFDDEDDDLFSTAPVKSTPKAGIKQKASATKTVENLFDEEEDLFGNQTANKVTEQPTQVEEKKVDKPKKKLPAGAVSMFGNAPNPLAAALKQKLGVENSDEEEIEDKALSEDEKSRSGSIKSNHSTVSSSGSLNKPIEAVKKGANPSPSGSSNSLFADEPDDDLFSSKPTKPASKVTKKKSSLFSEEDTKDDLFGGGTNKEPASKKPALTKKSTPAADLFGGDDDSPEDDLFGIVAAKPKADSGKKKPVGGVALFGGADLFAKKPPPLAEEEKTEEIPKPAIEKTHEVTKPTPRKNTLSLFDEDGDDLFGGGSKDLIKSGNKTADSVSSKKETKGRSKSKSLFADEDVLFGGADTPSVDLFGESPPGTPQKISKTTKPKPAAKNTEPPIGGISVKGATTASSSTDLFGVGDEEEDLFGTKAKTDSQQKVLPKVEDGKLKLDDATTTETSDEPVEKKVDEPVVIKPKKPAGAVSMFGGIDPLAGLKKKQKSETTVTKDPLFDEGKDEGLLFTKPSDIKRSEAAPKEASNASKPSEAPKPSDAPKPSEAPKPSAFKKPVGGVSLFGGFDPLGGTKNRTASKPEEPQTEEKEDLFGKSTIESSAEDKPASPPKGIGKLKANLLINPAALLPGAAPPSKDIEPAAVDFDKPAESTTLTSASKDRVKIITRRRPMSRKARKQAALSAELDLDPEQIMSGNFSGASLDNISSSIVEKSSRSSDLFGNDDLLVGVSKVSSQTNSILRIGQETIVESVEDDIFSKEFTKTRSSSIKQSAVAVSQHVEDDLFTSSNNFSASSTTTLKSKKVTTTTSSSSSSKQSISTKVNVSDDDLFSALESNKEVIVSERKSEEISDKVKEVDTAPPSDVAQPSETKKSTLPDDDDIFANSSIIKKKETKPPVVEDDIFSDSILNKPAPKAEEKFDDDDIFAAATTKKEKKKKQVTKDEDLFKDNTDIFADLPASKPKEKKKKKTTTSSKKSVFKDDVDDIFADSNLQAKPKKETEKKKKTSSKKKEEIEDIFDDPLNAGP